MNIRGRYSTSFTTNPANRLNLKIFHLYSSKIDEKKVKSHLTIHKKELSGG
jgi:hypothetical protein